jgi:hypothetical protein
MTPERWQQVKELLHEALQIALRSRSRGSKPFRNDPLLRWYELRRLKWCRRDGSRT